MRVTVLSGLLAVGAGCTMTAPAERGELTSEAAQGRVLVQRHCGDCHAWRLDDRSRHPAAPALRTLSRTYPVASLEEALAEGIVVGHPDMPEFRFSPQAVEALIAYLEYVQEPIE